MPALMVASEHEQCVGIADLECPQVEHTLYVGSNRIEWGERVRERGEKGVEDMREWNKRLR